MMPDSVFYTLTGEPFSLSRVRGKTVLLNFWASWCPPCVSEFPAMLELARRSKGKIALVAVSLDKGPAEVNRFLERFPQVKAALKENPDIFLLLDKHGDTAASQFAVLRLPESFAIDASGHIEKKFVGAVDWLSPEVVSYFDSLSGR